MTRVRKKAKRRSIDPLNVGEAHTDELVGMLRAAADHGAPALDRLALVQAELNQLMCALARRAVDEDVAALVP